MIRFSVSLVVVAVGLLIAGVVTSRLLLVYIAIGVSGVALLALGVGAAVNWRELTGKPKTAAAEVGVPGLAAAQQAAAVAQSQAPVSATAGAPATGSGWPATPSAPSRPGYLPTEPRPASQPAAAQPAAGRPADPFPPAAPPQPASASRPQTPARDAWEWPAVPVPDRPLSQTPGPPQPAEASATAEAPAPSEPPVPAQAPPAGDQPSGQDQSPAKDELPEQARAHAQEQASVEGQAPAQQQQPDDRQDGRGASEPEPVSAASATSAATTADSQSDKAGPPDKANQAEPAGPDLNLEVTVVPGVPRYHNARCILIRFMGENDLDKMTLAAAREVGCTPCRACLPDQPEKSPE